MPSKKRINEQSTLNLDLGRLPAARQGRKRAKTKYIGVSWFEPRQLWRARLAGTTLGYFQSERDAARAYDEAAIKKYDPSARVNFPASKSSAAPDPDTTAKPFATVTVRIRAEDLDTLRDRAKAEQTTVEALLLRGVGFEPATPAKSKTPQPKRGCAVCGKRIGRHWYETEAGRIHPECLPRDVNTEPNRN